MGYTSLHLEKNQEKEYLTEAIQGANVKTLKILKKGSVWFAAQQYTTTGEIFAVIILTQRKGTEFYYNIFDETCGPYHTPKCPQSIMKLLTPTENEIANNWREKQNDTPKPIKNGQVAVLNKPIKFSNGDYYSRFLKRGRKFVALTDTGFEIRVSISKAKLHRLGEGYEVFDLR